MLGGELVNKIPGKVNRTGLLAQKAAVLIFQAQLQRFYCDSRTYGFGHVVNIPFTHETRAGFARRNIASNPAAGVIFENTSQGSFLQCSQP